MRPNQAWPIAIGTSPARRTMSGFAQVMTLANTSGYDARA